jgi:iron complex transport system permease protein
MEPSGATNAIIAWLAGSLAGHGWNELRRSAPYAAFGLALALCTLPALNVMRLGERRADSLGVSVARTQYLVIASASLLTSAAVALSGMIGFVGLLSPHIARRTIGGDVRSLVPCAALVGGVIVTIADVAARTLAPPGELPIGALVALFGVPAFFFIIMRGTTRLHGKEIA